MAYAGPIEDVVSKAREFQRAIAAFTFSDNRLSDTSTRLSTLQLKSAKLPAPQRIALAARIAALRSEIGALARAKALLGPPVAKARDLLAKILPGSFGIVPIVAAPLAVAALVGATALLVGWTKRESRLRAELELEERKLAAVLTGELPVDAIRPPADKPSPLQDAKGLLVAGAALAALVMFGPKLARRFR